MLKTIHISRRWCSLLACLIVILLCWRPIVIILTCLLYCHATIIFANSSCRCRVMAPIASSSCSSSLDSDCHMRFDSLLCFVDCRGGHRWWTCHERGCSYAVHATLETLFSQVPQQSSPSWCSSSKANCCHSDLDPSTSTNLNKMQTIPGLSWTPPHWRWFNSGSSC